MRIFLKKQSGFTLIELLVVISIIGFLASASMVMLNSARIKARNEKRMAEIKQIQTALEMFLNHYQRYPSSATAAGEAAGSCADTSWDDSDCREFIPGLTGSNVRSDNPDGIVFLSKVPGDPLGPDGVNSTCSRSYAYTRPTLTTYIISVKPEATLSFPDCGRCSGYDICFTNP